MSALPDKRGATGPVAWPLRLRGTRLQLHLRDPRFWAVQGLVMLATAVHVAEDAVEVVAAADVTYLYIVMMYGLYLIPIIYASLNFGRAGAIPTAIWAGLLSLPNTALWHGGYEQVAEVLQHFMIIGLAVVIASRVDREVTARHAAERAAVSQRRSEANYRSLFEAAGEAILVFDEAGRIRAANAAGASMFGAPVSALRDRSLAGLLGTEAAAHVQAVAAGLNDGVQDLRWVQPNGHERWLEPVCSRVTADGDDAVIQALFHDVTNQRQRQRDLESYARQIVVAQEEERRRIAHELHDGPLQELNLLCRGVDELAVEREMHPSSTRGVGDIRQKIEAIADEIRRLSRDLRPSILDDLGLVPAVRWLVEEMEQRTGIEARIDTNGDDRRIAPEAELGLFRIAQEALRNVERHAGASEIAVSLTVDDREVRLVVEDDGRGMATADVSPSAARSGKLGLLGMHERARLFGGTLSIASAPDQGTRVTVVLALPSCGE